MVHRGGIAMSWMIAPLAMLMVAAPTAARARDDAWVDEMKKVHARFSGKKGTFAQFGDSITITMAYWSSLRGGGRNMNAETAAAYKRVEGHMKEECWSGWKGPEFGNNGSMTIRWAHENVGKWLEKLNPEVALIMFGTNDLNAVPLEEYEMKTREVVRKCLENGTVVILSTIPPRHNMLEKARTYAEAARKIARELRVPLCDFFGECLKRRPEDWDGAAEKFKEYKDYDVPTLLARDGVHPSNPKAFSNDYSEEGLRSNGFVLRNYVGLLAYAEVIGAVLSK
jgi:lysophospholipase L1-like esterase